jgi:hypothetical protein
MKRALRNLLALGMGALGIYVGLIAVQQGAEDLGIWCFIVGAIIEYCLLISGPDGYRGRKDD